MEINITQEIDNTVDKMKESSNPRQWHAYTLSLRKKMKAIGYSQELIDELIIDVKDRAIHEKDCPECDYEDHYYQKLDGQIYCSFCNIHLNEVC